MLCKDITVKIQNIIIPIVLSSRENCSLIVREDHRQRIMGKRVPISIFEAKAKELTEYQRRLRKRELHHL